MTRKRFTEHLNNIVEQIRINYRPQKIILYGSVLKGTDTPHSDVDLLIIKKTKRRFIERISDVLLCCDCDVPLEPLVYTPEEIKSRQKLGDFFIKDILKHGKVLYG
ncbi:MAG TPA: nucleotidyltransferase domain-containing protein [Candidatus Omnitrophota bacterium]|nr:nucleotidyltransferase domain-containing protein [Candidatus Omnitrophota bacterium]